MNRTVTGERVVTSEGGFNPTWQRHVAAYALCADALGGGRVVDIGCGVGHSYDLLSARETVGVDLDAGALRGQQRETEVADMRALPFVDGSFDAAISVHSIEHIPNAERAVAEMARVIGRDCAAVIVTPNRLTFARPDEIIDPYHYVEYDADQLGALGRSSFDSVELAGIFGSARYRALVTNELAKLDRLLAMDPLRLRRAVPRSLRQRLYDWRLSRERSDPEPVVRAIGVGDFTLAREHLDEALDVVAICRGPRR